MWQRLTVLVVVVLAGVAAARPASARQGAAAADDLQRCTKELTGGDPFSRARAAGCLRRLGPAAAPAIPQLIDALSSDTYFEHGGGSAAVGDEAAAALVSIGAAALEPVREAAERHADLAVRARAVRVLGGLNDPRGIGAILRALTSSNRDIEQEAVNALRGMTAPEVGDRLLELAKGPAAGARTRAVSVLVDRKDQRVGPILRARLTSTNEDTRLEAVLSLIAIGAPDAMDVAIGALNDPHAIVRQAVAENLGKLGDRRAVPALILRLRDEYSLSCHEIVEALGVLGDSRAVAPLRARLAIERDTSLKEHIEAVLKRLAR